MANSAPCKVLIVEDDPGISKFLRTTLATNHYEALWTDTGVKALEMISSHCPDCILLDLGLPDLDGTEIIRRVRSWAKTPIIVISARTIICRSPSEPSNCWPASAPPCATPARRWKTIPSP